MEVLGAALNSLNKPLQHKGYKLEAQSTDQVIWRRNPLWWWPFSSQRIVMSFADLPNGGAMITIAGDGPRGVAKAFESLEM